MVKGFVDIYVSVGRYEVALMRQTMKDSIREYMGLSCKMMRVLSGKHSTLRFTI